MLNRARRTLLAGFLFAACFGLGLSGGSVHAQTGWEYVPELGGYLDWDTGLVWGEHSSLVVQNGGGRGWEFMRDNYLPSYRAMTGIPDWRMPTIAESQIAAAHGIDAVIPSASYANYCWTSETKSKGWANKAHYGVEPNGGYVALFNKSTLSLIPVYRAFTP
jgi:hypothetical protein